MISHVIIRWHKRNSKNMIFIKVDMAVVRMEKAGEIVIATAGEGGSHHGGSTGGPWVREGA